MKTELLTDRHMNSDKQADNGHISSSIQERFCHIFLESYQAYREDVIDEGMAYEDFVTNFFGPYFGSNHENDLIIAYQAISRMFNKHKPIIEYRFKSSSFGMDDLQSMLFDLGHCDYFFDRSLLDIQLRAIIPKLEQEGVIPLLCRCVNDIALFHDKVNMEDLNDILTGHSHKDYGIYNVSHFAYFMKKMERKALTIQHWQSMVWNLSRIVYKGRYLNQHLISSTVHNIASLKRRPWQYDTIDYYFRQLHNVKA